MKKSAQEPANSGTRSGDRLTKREQEILRVMTEGFANREIADKLFLSPSTINTHRTNLTRKLNIYDTAGLVRFAISEGYVKTAIST
jgi:DNA-binding NarL/FixJ family response regulator